MKCVVLAAGIGSRLKEINHCKPLVKIQNRSLLEHVVVGLQRFAPEKITIVLNEEARNIPVEELSFFNSANIDVCFRNTESSLHTLYEAIKEVKIISGEHLFVTMVDTLVRPDDLFSFVRYCESEIDRDESCIMVTPYVEDEKPLTVSVDDESNVIEFQTPLDQSQLITSGMYYFSHFALDKVKVCVNGGVFKMRNYLKTILESGVAMKSFKVEKTMDVDRPEDIVSANNFLLE